jgi:hypothetical protein
MNWLPANHSPRGRLAARRWACAISLVLLVAALPAGGQVNVTTSMYNNQRTSVNFNELFLTPSNVNSDGFGRLFSQTVDGQVYAQPLYVANMLINGTMHNVVYVATQHDSVYAFDADSAAGTNALPLWHTTFLSANVTPVPTNGPGGIGCGDITPENGITGTPVIDTATNTLYVVAETLENGTNYVKKLHALDITTGLEKAGSPVAITATVTVPGQSAVTFNTEWEMNRPGLLLYNGVVYIGFGAHCDFNNYRGWVLGYNAASLAQVFVFSTQPSSSQGRQGGIWMGGEGLPMDSGSNLFIATGNGKFDTVNTPPLSYGDSIIRIDLALGPTVQDYFTPHTQDTMDSGDQDLGSGGMAILPDQTGPNPYLLVQRGKDGHTRVVKRDGMGHYNSSTNNIVQELTGGSALFSSPVYFNGKLYFWGSGDVARAYSVTNGMLSTNSVDAGLDGFQFPGATPTISANGTNGAILWGINSHGYSSGGPNVLFAYDANNLSAGALYSSQQVAARDNPGGAVKFSVPTVANGKVYVGASGKLSVFGLFVAGGTPALMGTSSRKDHGSAGTYDLPLAP